MSDVVRRALPAHRCVAPLLRRVRDRAAVDVEAGGTDPALDVGTGRLHVAGCVDLEGAVSVVHRDGCDRSRLDIVRNDLTVCSHCQPIYTRVARGRISQAVLVPSPDLRRRADVRGVHDEDLVRLAVSVGVMQDYIAAQVARDELRRSFNGLVHKGTIWLFLECLDVARDRVRDVCPGISKGAGRITVPEHVPDGRHAFRRCCDAQRFKIDVHRVAQIHALRQSLKLFKAQSDGIRQLCEVVVADVVIRQICELCRQCRAALRVHLSREVNRNVALKVQSQTREDLGAECRSVVNNTKRIDRRDQVAHVELLGQFRQVLAVADRDASVSSSVLLQACRVVIK